jgi:hypothetical protein
LGRIYSEYLIRHTKETRDKAGTSKVKKSAKKIRSDKKKIDIQTKEKNRKNIKPKHKSRSETKKPIEPNTLDESRTLNEEARQQLKDANELISRMNAKLNNIQ